jgi:hypothetical protein
LRRGLDDEAKRVPSIPVPDLVARLVALLDPIVRGRPHELGRAATSLVGEGATNVGMDAAAGDGDRARHRAQPSGGQLGLSGGLDRRTNAAL